MEIGRMIFLACPPVYTLPGTWNDPEKIAKCDIFTCGDKCEPNKAVEYLGKAFKAKKIETDDFDRLL